MTEDEKYTEFVEKFKPKVTTDDCYTPLLVYEVVKDWACEEYGISPDSIVRPFYPGGDYEHFHYPDGCVVLDNPPFSILSKICAFYLDRGIPFFLFAPSLTAFNARNALRMNHIICDADITYENGAIVRTAFVTSFGGDIIAQTAPELKKRIDIAVKETYRSDKKTIPKYEYPDHVLTAAMMQKYSKYGIDFKVSQAEAAHISALDSQRRFGKSIFGSGLLLSDKKAAEKAAAEKAAAEKAAAEKAAAEKAAAEKANAIVWELSDRERDIINRLNQTQLKRQRR